MKLKWQDSGVVILSEIKIDQYVAKATHNINFLILCYGFKKFHSGDMDLHEGTGHGHKLLLDIENLMEIMKTHPETNTWILRSKLGVASQKTFGINWQSERNPDVMWVVIGNLELLVTVCVVYPPTPLFQNFTPCHKWSFWPFSGPVMYCSWQHLARTSRHQSYYRYLEVTDQYLPPFVKQKRVYHAAGNTIFHKPSLGCTDILSQIFLLTRSTPTINYHFFSAIYMRVRSKMPDLWQLRVDH